MLPRRAPSSSASPPTPPPSTHRSAPPSGSPVARRHRAEAGPAAARDGAAPPPGLGNQLNADVLEVIAEYACGSVADACALRAANKGNRRAVDTAVRGLVYVDQPQLSPFVSRSSPLRPAASGGPTHAPLQIDTHLLRTALYASTSDFASIVRLIVVAFALDGAKDELREGGVCGPRLLKNVCGCNALLVSASSNAKLGDVCRLMTHLSASEPRRLSAAADLFLLPREARPALTHLDVSRLYSASQSAGRAIGRLIETFGPQLEFVRLPFLRKEWLPALEKCTKLQQFALTFDGSDAAVQVALAGDVCRIFACSGAPLTKVCFPLFFDRAASSAPLPFDHPALVALLESVPTIVEVKSCGLPLLPPAVAARMRTVGGAPGPQSRSVMMNAQQDDLARAFPALEELWLDSSAAANHLPASIPPSLTALKVSGASTYVAAALERVAALLAQKGRTLARVEFTPDSAGGPCFDLEIKRRLLPFAPVVSRVDASLIAPALLGDLDDVVNQLTALQTLGTPSVVPRCLLHGRHTRLQCLAVGVVDVPIEDLLRACPMLVHVSWESTVNENPNVPAGWQLTQSSDTGGTLRRRSFDF